MTHSLADDLKNLTFLTHSLKAKVDFFDDRVFDHTKLALSTFC